ncbi:MAG: ester cyclase [Longispora sp.]|nr:ester cyclase [Longispora sp. (in: high G+C Gram-positive bacteria)]
MPTSPSSVRLVTDFLDEVWSRGNINAAPIYVAERYTVHHDPGDPWDGCKLTVAQFQERARESRCAFPNHRFAVHEVLGADDKVMVAWQFHGTHMGDLPGFPASGKCVTLSGMTVYHLNNAKLTAHWQVVDRLGVYHQLRSR